MILGHIFLTQSVEIPVYPSILTPQFNEYSALPNNVHASIQYGEDNKKNKVISRHFYHNGYEEYQHQDSEEEPNQSKGLVINFWTINK